MLFRVFRGLFNLVIMAAAIVVAYMLMTVGMIAGIISIALIALSERVTDKLWIPCPGMITKMKQQHAVRQGRALKAAGV